MNTPRQTSQALHDEHVTLMGLCGRVEQALARAPRKDPGGDEALVAMIVDLARHLRGDVGRHFEFEENELFPRMRDAGEGDIAELLQEEHEAIREAVSQLSPLADAASAATLDSAGWDALRRVTLELVERQVAHIQKEEMALLPLLDDLLDDDTDRELAFAYAAG